MLNNLAKSTPEVAINADVLVIGAGIAGLLLSTRLAARGLHVVVLESGDLTQEDETHPLNQVVYLGSFYAGAEHGRFRCLGGTSTRWGGAMLPYLAADMKARRVANSAWPIAHSELMTFLPQIEALFDLPPGPYDRPELVQTRDGKAPDFIPRLAKWPPFRKRNVASLFGREVRSAHGPEIWLNAIATNFIFRPDGLLDAVRATGPNGQQIEIRARETAIAAGAIESTRLLLLADLQQDCRIFTPDDVLGRYFFDHLSVEVAKIKPFSWKILNRVAGFRFQGRGMRNLRFEPADREDVRAEISPGFAHIAFPTTGAVGFDALRDLYRSRQRREGLSVTQLRGLVATAPWLARATWWRFYERRLLYPGGADVELHMVTEQVPRANNRIGLSSGQRDRYGQPLATIDWRISDEDRVALTTATTRFVALWRESSLTNLGEIIEHPRHVTLRALEKSGGIYHPGGSTRMGRSPRDGVVDVDLRTFRVPNLRVVSTSAFPSGGSANPTMMLMMASLRAAESIEASVKQACHLRRD